MKLIDLLVQELPKRGGWPHNALSITQDDDGLLCVWDTNNPHYDGFSWKHHTGNSLVYYWHGIEDVPLSCDHRESIVTYWQYKAALAASQKPTWNGEGVPPVGCECEISFSGKSLGQCEVLFVGDSLIVWKQKSSQQEGSGYHRHMNIRPLRTEAERKHEAVLESICAVLTMVAQDYKREDEAKLIYEAIAAGKIPGVKLDD
ncbi:hypothetical protein KGB41_gp28 [Salmonella virus KFS-SE2]|uniref:Uncharacterized protein n=1 Tax=Salmonella virus KFS-SE2 TaxID=2583286 RepID=A0A4Y5TLK8_9CAUD|nr:hypothetical protein KGB41_gp28 [Salmonella virus KFS-SE2]QDB70185.1 hypothetical protein [Salmonella virus KFS-SE2]